MPKKCKDTAKLGKHGNWQKARKTRRAYSWLSSY